MGTTGGAVGKGQDKLQLESDRVREELQACFFAAVAGRSGSIVSGGLDWCDSLVT